MTGLAGAGLLDRCLRPGLDGPAQQRLDLYWLIGLALLMIGAGLGLRDPWPADEPRFALVAQDMLRSGDWLIPRVGGDLYADKPPFYFWLLAVSMALTGSVRAGFLLPSLLAGLGTVVLVYDVLRRAHGREAAFAGAVLLLCTFQFVWQARQAQIDATLCFLTTLSLYGLLRHLCLGPAPGWFIVGWAAAGIGVITKGVGFLPLLAILPWAVLAARGWPAPGRPTGWGWILGPLALLAAIALWFVPMWLHTGTDPALLAYRNEILFDQTVSRYAQARHHREPVWYFLVYVVPLLWLPTVALLPWLLPRWRKALHERNTLTAVLLVWVLMVLVFFSASTGKRGVYILPALPALAMAAAPWLPELLRTRAVRRMLFALGALIAAAAAAAAGYLVLDSAATARIVEQLGADPRLALAVMALCAVAAMLVFGLRAAGVAYLAVLASALLVTGLLVSPRSNEVRSGREFMLRVEHASTGFEELGLVGAKEQYLLQLRRASINFGHARWAEREREADDAAAWLAQRAGRALLVDEKVRVLCFKDASATALGTANRQQWFLVEGQADPACVTRGDPGRAIAYRPPRLSVPSDERPAER